MLRKYPDIKTFIEGYTNPVVHNFFYMSSLIMQDAYCYYESHFRMKNKIGRDSVYNGSKYGCNKDPKITMSHKLDNKLSKYS